MARLIEKKGVEYGIRAVCRLHKQFPAIRYTIVGDGPLRDSFMQLIHELQATDYIHLVGTCNQNELRRRYARTDVFLLPSVTAANGDMEGQGLVLQEAQASGVPVVSTWHNGIPEGMIADGSGFLVPERDIEALTERLAYLVTHSKRRQQMGDVGRAFVQRCFDVRHLNHQLLALYTELL